MENPQSLMDGMNTYFCSRSLEDLNLKGPVSHGLDVDSS